jgi:hypothetical protein
MTITSVFQMEEITVPDRLVLHGIYIQESVSTFLIHRAAKCDSQCDLFRLAFIKPQVSGNIIVGASTWVDINVRTLLKVCDFSLI